MAFPPLAIPMRLLEQLCPPHVDTHSFGNTPKPTSAEREFALGLQALGTKRWPLALQKFLLAKERAAAEGGCHADAYAIATLHAGYVYACTGRLPEAIAHYLEALKWWEAMHGGTSPRLRGLLMDLGLLYCMAGDRSKGREVCQQARLVCPEDDVRQLADIQLTLDHLEAL